MIAVVIMSYVVGLPNLQLQTQITIADLTQISRRASSDMLGACGHVSQQFNH